ncbi:type I asparaginase, partial [Candidatus Micrarchaeota archaeon]|nr:type I asparaginase [Candidatus Micrarchaeota archaeon]
MYSKSLEKKLKELGIETGDQIRIEKKDSAYEGLLMPKGEETDIVLLKLENGYNIGIDSSDAKVSLVKKAAKKPKKIEKDATGKGEISILDWKVIAKEILNEIKDGAEGIVLMHGTDTMHYSSAAISFMVQNPKVPIIFVGAQRSADRPSSENEMNLLNAVYAAKSDLGEVGVCMHATTNDDYCFIHRGTRVRKMHSSTRDAFKSINSKPLMAVNYREKKVERLSDYRKRGGETKVDLDMNSNVALIYVHPNIKPALIKSLDSYDGVLLVGTGLGNAPTNPFGDKDAVPIIKGIKGLTDSGVAVVMASQTIYGRLNMHVYTAGRLLIEAGVIGDQMDWTPE